MNLIEFFFRAIILLLYFPNCSQGRHNCIHNNLTKDFNPIVETNTKNNKILQQTLSPHPINIHFDGSGISGATKQEINLVMNKTLPVAAEFFRKRLNFSSTGTILKFNTTYCYDVKIFFLKKKKSIN